MQRQSEVPMSAASRARFWIEAALAALSGVLCVLTLVWRDWIEAVFRVDPDRQSGALEWLVVAALLALTAAFGVRARSRRQDVLAAGRAS
jgi:hypothetical protein